MARPDLVETALKASLQRIFAIQNVTLDQPAPKVNKETNLPEFEQDRLFVDVLTTKGKVSDGKFRARVSGKILLYSQAETLPLGYLSKQIQSPKVAKDVKDFFFFEVEESSNGFLDLVQRSASFIFFFNSQYDPDLGSITTVNITEG